MVNVADAGDFNEWRTGNRATAMTFAAATFAQKLGSAAGSAARPEDLSATLQMRRLRAQR